MGLLEKDFEMVVINKGEFGKLGPPPENDDDDAKCSNKNMGMMKTTGEASATVCKNVKDTNSYGSGYKTDDCDVRGMLTLNQELVINKKSLFELYRMDKGAPFATGLYAQVKRCRGLRSHGACQPNYYAAKFSPRKRPGQNSDEECLENLHEIALLSQLKNPYIISFTDAFILEDYVVTIMEFAPGGDLQSVIDADLVLLEKDASRYIYQLLEALRYLHERHIAHLDIKPQNLLLMGEFPSCDIKLCDFEISRVIKPGMEVREILGTPDYVAPEILLYEPLTTSADIWSVGILCYVLLTGFSPFGGDTDQETFSNIIHEPIDFPDELFEDVSPGAIDFIVRMAVKSARSRPTSDEMQKHDFVKSFIPKPPPVQITPPLLDQTSISLNHSGPKKRSPRKTMALSGSSTASAAGRRPSARAILRACKSAYDLSKMGGKTKSREVLIEKMKLASGESASSTGGSWKLRKNLSKSREQLWESKIQLSKSCEKINNNLPGSTRWASIANFPSLDLNAKKCSMSQESVISVMSTCTNIGNSSAHLQQQELLDWQQQSLDDFVNSCCPTPPRQQCYSVPSTPVPNFDLSSPINNLMICDSAAPFHHHGNATGPDFNYPSLVQDSGICSGDLNDELEDGACGGDPSLLGPIDDSSVELESQKSVAELIMTFGGKIGANAKKLDLKNQFEPILEVDGSEEQQMSLGDCSDNNSTSGVSSIVASSTAASPTACRDFKTAEGKQGAESGNFSMNSGCSSMEPDQKSLVAINKANLPIIIYDTDSSSRSSSRRNSKTSQQLRDDMRSRAGRTEFLPGSHPLGRRGSSASPPKTISTVETPTAPIGLKSILKKPSNLNLASISKDCTDSVLSSLLSPGSCNSSRRGSIPGNCRLYDTHTISSLAKVPKRSILKNTQTNGPVPKVPVECGNNPLNKGKDQRACSKSPENINASDNPPQLETGSVSLPPTINITEAINNDINMITGNKTPEGPKPLKIIPKGIKPRERPSFILIGGGDTKKKPVSKSPVRRKSPEKTKPVTNPQPTTVRRKTSVTSNPSMRPPKSQESSFDEPDLPEEPKTKQTCPEGDKATETPDLNSAPEGKKPDRNSHSSSVSNTNKPNTSNTISKNNKTATPSDRPTVCKSQMKVAVVAEPAAVAIKIFPPDPVLIPKSSQPPLHPSEESTCNSSGLNLNSINNDSNNNSSGISGASIPQIKINGVQNDAILPKVKSPRLDRKVRGGSVRRGEKSMWGIVCTGSVGRAMERFETGIGNGKSKLRRGSVPDF